MDNILRLDYKFKVKRAFKKMYFILIYDAKQIEDFLLFAVSFVRVCIKFYYFSSLNYVYLNYKFKPFIYSVNI